MDLSNVINGMAIAAAAVTARRTVLVSAAFIAILSREPTRRAAAVEVLRLLIGSRGRHR